MAILTPGSDSHYLRNLSISGISSGDAWAISAWLMLLSETGSSSWNGCFEFNNGSAFADIGHDPSANELFFECSRDYSALSFGISQNTWYHVYCWMVNGTSYIGIRTIGGSYSTDNDNDNYSMPAALNRLYVGRGTSSSQAGNWRIAAVKAWVNGSSANLPTVAQLQEEGSIIRPLHATGSLLCWYPFLADEDFGDYSGNGFALSEVGSNVTGADGPPVPWGAHIYVPGIAAGTTHQLTGTAAAAVSTGGTITCVRPVSGTAAAQIATTGALAAVRALSGTSAVGVTTTGGLAAIRALSSTAAAAVTTTGALSATRGLSSTAAAATSTSGTLTAVRPLAATAAVTSVTSSPALLGIRLLSGTAAASVSTTGALAVVRSVSGTAAVSTSTVGALAAVRACAGTASVSVTTSGALAGVFALSGTASAAVATSGSLTKEGAIALSGTAAASTTTAGTMAVIRRLSGSGAVATATTGALSITRSLSSTAGVVSVTAGALLRVRGISGLAGALVSTTGTLTATRPMSGTASVVCVTAGAFAHTVAPDARLLSPGAAPSREMTPSASDRDITTPQRVTLSVPESTRTMTPHRGRRQMEG